MSRLVERIAAARDAKDPAAVAAAIPYARFMGITALFDGDELLGKLIYSERLIGNPALPALHGGTLGALLESTAIFQLLWSSETLVLPKTINITVDYLRSGRPRDTFARGIITRRGRRVANVRVEAWQDDRDHPIAIAHAHFLIAPSEDQGDAGSGEADAGGAGD